MPSFSGYAVAHGCALAARRTARVCASSDSNDGHLMARYVVDEHVVDGTTISLGSGRLIGLIVKYLAEKVSEGSLKDCTFVANNVVTASEAAFHGLRLDMPGSHDQWDVALQEVDEVDPADLSFIFGRGPNPQIRDALYGMEKARQTIVLVDDASKLKENLGGVLPVVIEGGDKWEEAAEEIDTMLLGEAEVWRRAAEGAATSDPRATSNPYVTEDGEYILDVKFYDPGLSLDGEMCEYKTLYDEIRSVAGVRALGLCVEGADVVYAPSVFGLQSWQRAAS